MPEAIAAYRDAIRLRPDLADARNNLGVVLHAQGKLEQAIGEYRAAIRLEPNFAPPHSNLAWALVQSPKRPRDDYNEGLAHARKAVELDPKNGDGYRTLALVEYRLGHWPESLAASKESLTLKNGGDAFNWFLHALAHGQKGDKDEARKWFDKAVGWTREREPENAELRRLWTEAAELLGQPRPDASPVTWECMAADRKKTAATEARQDTQCGPDPHG